MMRQVTSPFAPVVSIAVFCSADSMSAAVVPGAKLLASTMNGPAVPRILRPPPETTFACTLLFTADAILFVRAIWEAAEFGREGGLKGLLLLPFTLELDEER